MARAAFTSQNLLVALSLKIYFKQNLCNLVSKLRCNPNIFKLDVTFFFMLLDMKEINVFSVVKVDPIGQGKMFPPLCHASERKQLRKKEDCKE